MNEFEYYILTILTFEKLSVYCSTVGTLVLVNIVRL